MRKMKNGANDLRLQKFGKLLPLRVVGRCPTSRALIWECACDCGKITNMRSAAIVASNRACFDCTRGATHRMSETPTYKSWQSMKDRCLNSSCKDWEYYGGRGITIDPFFLVFENFFGYLGERPEGMTLDRFPNNDGNYEPGNVRWATAEQQANNRRDNVTAS